MVFLLLLGVNLTAQTAPLSKEAQQALAKKYPALRVQAKVGIMRKPVPGSFYLKTMTMTPEIVIESAPTQPMSAGSASFVLITMDTEEKYRRSEQMCKVATNETLPIPEVQKGSRRKFEFAGMKSQFDGDRDASNVGGDVYKYYMMAVFADDKQFLHFETNCPALEKHLAAHPEERLKYLGLQPGTKFTTKFP